ncbi:MAG: TauD/TfdA family dioxygenase [Alphaproteobacteria bacterium]|nr:TauD/TfdA family dioxygenase [Alphaproteobacteria bacterium]
MTNSKIEVIPSGGALGADVSGFDINAMSAADFDIIRAAWLEHLVLRVRGQDFDDPVQIEFGRGFGPLELSPRALLTGQGWYPDMPEMSRITNIRGEKGEKTGSLGHGDAYWHTDMNYLEEPPMGSLLHALQVPQDGGGETRFCNMYLALETLPAELRRAIDGKTLKHEKVHSSDGTIRPGLKDPGTDDVRRIPGPIHPMIMTHPDTERDVLYLGRRINGYIMGMPVRESDDLLDQIWAHATQEKFVWEQNWRVGDMIMWDNRSVMHSRKAFGRDDARLMHRLVLKGTQPFHAPLAA